MLHNYWAATSKTASRVSYSGILEVAFSLLLFDICPPASVTWAVTEALLFSARTCDVDSIRVSKLPRSLFECSTPRWPFNATTNPGARSWRNGWKDRKIVIPKLDISVQSVKTLSHGWIPRVPRKFLRTAFRQRPMHCDTLYELATQPCHLSCLIDIGRQHLLHNQALPSDHPLATYATTSIVKHLTTSSKHLPQRSIIAVQLDGFQHGLVSKDTNNFK